MMIRLTGPLNRWASAMDTNVLPVRPATRQSSKVDLVERAAVERSENYIRRRHILESLRPIHVA